MENDSKGRTTELTVISRGQSREPPATMRNYTSAASSRLMLLESESDFKTKTLVSGFILHSED